MTEQRRPRLALLTNIIAPYRIPVYRALADDFETAVLISGAEGNRAEWPDNSGALPNAKVRRVWGWTWHWASRGKGGVFDHRYVHVNPGLLVALWRTRPDVIVSNELGFRTLSALLYGTLFRVPVFVWWGGTLHTERSRRFPKRILRRIVARWARHWISYGRSSTAYLRTLGVRDQRIVQIQNSIDESLYCGATSAEFEPKQRPAFLFVGQLIGRKGVDVLLRVAALLQDSGKEFSLYLMGGGPERARCESLIADLGLRNVVILPPRRVEEMPGLYRSMDWLVFPTMEDVWGLVVNEALWSGLQVIASRYAGCAEELLPAEHIFDPAQNTEFLETWRAAIEGRLPGVDISKLWKSADVENILVRAINDSLARTSA